MYIIKEYEKEYNKQINEFIISILGDEYGYVKAREVLENEDNSLHIKNMGKFWMALDENDNIIGTILIFKHDDKSMEIKKLYVKKEYRGKGIADELYQKAVEYCKEMSFKKIFIGTYDKLERAIQFYLKRRI